MPRHTRGEDVDGSYAHAYSSTSLEQPLSPKNNQTTLEQRLNDFIQEAREENTRLKETITKEMLGEIQELRHETLSPLHTVESALAKIMEMIQSQGETDVNAVTLRSRRALPNVVPPPPQSIPTEEPRLDNEETSIPTEEPRLDNEETTNSTEEPRLDNEETTNSTQAPRLDNEETTNSTQAERALEEELRKEEIQPQPSWKGKEVMQEPPLVPKAKLPFPQRFRTDIDNAKYDKFLQMLRQLHVDMPFIDALGEMPRYSKFLKDLLSNKKRLAETATVVLGEELDFVILDMDPDVEISLILGRPFLATARALIDVGEGKLVIRVGDESASFDEQRKNYQLLLQQIFQKDKKNN
ncbi:zonadhesin-like [Ipomoea triloba]|uniref:zonadhesin-like n=1 Tax=Ipomoea triloba TaxID=35885 RepID=UPI00125D93BA|nr:zonadhesin-like [Ipomoea triloba]